MENWNFPLFDEATAYLRGLGWTVFNPAEHDREKGFDGTIDEELPDGWTLSEALRWDYARIVEADAIVLLSGWPESLGARGECRVGLDCDLGFFLYSSGVLVALPRDDIEHVVLKEAAEEYARKHGQPR